tara:strand:- start:113 stop:862 length:750 start_codon:yes stop_codon:yes gene_type:complete
MNDTIKHKGIILAGGKGTRLNPLTLVTSKQLLPIYDRPMIFYPLQTLIDSGIKDILIITNPEDIEVFEKLIGDGSEWNCSIKYAVQKKPEGIAQAFLIAKEWLNNDPVVLILGDNIFLKAGVSKLLSDSLQGDDGAIVFSYKVSDPSRYGIINFDKDKRIINIEEKPLKPLSNWAVTGLYVYDKNVVEYSEKLKPSERGELEITDLNNMYLDKEKLDVRFLSEDSYWLDAGTIDALLDASILVRDLSKK